MRRLRSLLGAVALAGGGLLTASLGGSPAEASPTLDVYNVKATASPIEVAVETGYSFLVYPDVQMPRATASIEAGQVNALASPADPGDGVDALPGLLVPQAESQGQAGLSGAAGQAPEPFKTVLNTAASVIPIVALANPFVTTPYEHVQVSYPNAQSPGRQQAAYFGTDPSVADPTGSIAVQGAFGKVVADKDLAVADAGAGAAVTVAPLGLHIGRSSAHVELHGLGDRATSDAVAEVDDVDLGLPQLPLPGGLPGLSALPQPLLHIGSIVSRVHTERVAGAPSATSTHSLEIAGVTVLGQSATIDDRGIHLMQQNLSLQPVVDALNHLFAISGMLDGQLKGVPVVGGQPIIPTGSMAGPVVTDQISHNQNEATSAVSGLTLSLTGTVLVPSETQNLLSIPPPIDPKNPPTLVASPATFTITLASVQSSTYGYTFPPLPPTSFSPQPPSGELSSEVPLQGVSTDLGTPVASASTSEGAAGPAVTRSVLPRTVRPASSFFGGLLSRPAALALASLAELVILVALVSAYLVQSAPTRPPMSAAELDMP